MSLCLCGVSHFVSAHWAPCKLLYHRCRRLRLCSVSPVSAACVFPVVLFSVTVTLRRNAEMFLQICGCPSHSLNLVPVLYLHLEVSLFNRSFPQDNSECCFRLWDLKLTSQFILSWNVWVVHMSDKIFHYTWGLFSGSDTMLLAWKFPLCLK
jgi:hypothetical protein